MPERRREIPHCLKTGDFTGIFLRNVKGVSQRANAKNNEVFKANAMKILTDLISRVKEAEASLPKMVGEALYGHGEDILELQKIQLLEGKASSGEDMRPYYSEDIKPQGHFYSVESAGRYAKWKESLNYPYSTQRNPDAPNLYINGRFHSELGVSFGADSVTVTGETGYAMKIIAKYGMSQFGLTRANWTVLLRERGVLEEINELFKQRIYGN